MKDTKKELKAVIEKWWNEPVDGDYDSSTEVLTSRIVERFDLILKPPISDVLLGELVMSADKEITHEFAGNKMRHLLAGRGFEIVKVTDEES